MSDSRLAVVTLFTRQLATMIAHGMPVDVSLDIIAGQADDASLRDLLRLIRDDVRAGSRLSEALAKYPGWFSALYVTVVKAGERGSGLDNVLNRLAAFLEKSAAFRSHILGGIVVPAVAAALAGLAGLWLLHAYSGIGGGVAVMVAVALCAMPAYLVLAFLPTGRSLPGMRPILQRVDLARFARIMGTLQRSGVPVIEGMETTAKSALNPAFGAAVMGAAERLRGGEQSIAVVMKETGAFPPMVVQMVAAGEETGKLDDMFLRIADFYDAECEAMVERMNRAAATILTFVVAGAMALLIQGWILYQMAVRVG